MNVIQVHIIALLLQNVQKVDDFVAVCIYTHYYGCKLITKERKRQIPVDSLLTLTSALKEWRTP
jgi:hypothetical protein